MGGGNFFFLYLVFFVINFFIQLISGKLTPPTTT